MKKVKTAGGIVIQDGKILLIKKNGGLALPKGHIEEGESEESAASRELLEETGHAVAIIKKIGSFSRQSKENSGEIVDKEIIIFLMSVKEHDKSKAEEEPMWVDTSEALRQMLYPEEKDFLVKYLDAL